MNIAYKLHTKNPVGIKAVENAVKERTKVDEISNLILDGVENLLRG